MHEIWDHPLATTGRLRGIMQASIDWVTIGGFCDLETVERTPNDEGQARLVFVHFIKAMPLFDKVCSLPRIVVQEVNKSNLQCCIQMLHW